MTELRLAGAVTIEGANALLKEFLDRFNARFGVLAQHPEAAYRPLGPGVCLDTALCVRHSRRVARDNTVKYRWRTLQLLPGTARSSSSRSSARDTGRGIGKRRSRRHSRRPGAGELLVAVGVVGEGDPHLDRVAHVGGNKGVSGSVCPVDLSVVG